MRLVYAECIHVGLPVPILFYKIAGYTLPLTELSLVKKSYENRTGRPGWCCFKAVIVGNSLQLADFV